MGKDEKDEKALSVVDRDVPDVQVDDRWAIERINPKAALERFEAARTLLAKLRPASIQATLSQDWVEMGKNVYLQGTGVERLGPLWGLRFETPKVVREEYDDGHYGYVVSGKVGSSFTGADIYVEGGRSSRDPFFGKDADPMDVRKAAVTNWMTRGASMVCGLRHLTRKDLEDNGIKGVTTVEYKTASKGGSAVSSELKAKQAAFHNELVKRTGDLQAAKDLLKELTRYDAYEKDGRQVPANAGVTSVDNLGEKALNIAQEKLKKHPTFGDTAKKPTREPGEEE